MCQGGISNRSRQLELTVTRLMESAPSTWFLRCCCRCWVVSIGQSDEDSLEITILSVRVEVQQSTENRLGDKSCNQDLLVTIITTGQVTMGTNQTTRSLREDSDKNSPLADKH